MKFKNLETGQEYRLEYSEDLYQIRKISPHGNFIRYTHEKKGFCLKFLAQHGAVKIDERETIL